MDKHNTMLVGVPMGLAEGIAAILYDHDGQGLVVQLEELMNKARSVGPGQGSKIAYALEACQWPDTSIGNKAIVLSAIQALRVTELENKALRAVLTRQPGFIRALERFEAEDGTFVRLDDVLGSLAASTKMDCETCSDEGIVGDSLDYRPCPNCAAAPPAGHAATPPEVHGEIRRLREALGCALISAESLKGEAIAVRNQLSELVSAVRTLNFGPAHAVRLRSDDEPCYLQRREWVEWVLGLCDSVSQVSPATAPADERSDSLPAFARSVISQLQRFQDCEGLTKEVDPDWSWFDTLTQLGLLQRAQCDTLMWEITTAGNTLLRERNPTTTPGLARLKPTFKPVVLMALDERAAFEAYRDKRNQVLEAAGHKPGSDWHVTQAHYATWEARGAAEGAVVKWEAQA